MESTNIKSVVHKNLLRLLIPALIVLSIVVYYVYVPTSHTTKISITHALQKTKEIDKLYTGVYIIPAVDKKYDFRKRDLPMHYLNQLGQSLGIGSGGNDDAKKVVKGYCKKRYEVSVGYNNITELLSNNEVIENACQGRTDKLPNPQILAVNCRSTEARGDYSGNDRCYRWDTDEKMRRNLLMGQMKHDDILEKVNKRGRESLKTLATIFCE
ncbi:MAG: hypothetical protein IJA79_08460 [Desulfovibrio sp.]|nr:hypothetical protein [Desulfovibrio sp.]